MKSSGILPFSGDLSDLSVLERDGFLIEEPVGNNSFAYSSGRSLYVAPVCRYRGHDSIKHGDDIVFWDEWGGDLMSYTGLETQLFGVTEGSGTPFFLCDNHNLVLEAWEVVKDYSPRLKVIHIDQHRDDAKFAGDPVDYMRTSRICDYIDFAKSAGWIESEHYSFTESEEFFSGVSSGDDEGRFILNIDLDIFAPDVTHVSTKEKLAVIKEAMVNAELITIATSPGFIDQSLAISLARLLISYL